MKRKIIALLSACMLCIPFITPVYADTISYWDGSYFAYVNNAEVELGTLHEVTTSGRRYRFSIKPNYSSITYHQNTDYLQYDTVFYIGEYSSISNSSPDTTYFRSINKIYWDMVQSTGNVYTTQTMLMNASNANCRVESVQVGSMYRIYVVSTQKWSYKSSNDLAKLSVFTGNVNDVFIENYYTGTNAQTSYWRIGLGYNDIGWDHGLRFNLANNETYLFNSLDRGYFREGVVNAFNGTSMIPSGSGGAGASGNTSDGYGNGVPSGAFGNSTDIQFDGSNNQVQTQTQSQSIDNNSMKQEQSIAEGAVTVNNYLSGGGGGSSGSTESDVDKINALDNLLQNQNVNTSFTEAIQNVNNFRQLGVAFADTTTVFLGWLPSWVTALLGLMFTLLFFFIILRLLKVFHG